MSKKNTSLNNPILKINALVKRFPGVLALNGVSLNFNKGEIHALMGENGAGKSTLIKVINGVHTIDSGQILLDGEIINPRSPRDAESLGISTVFQEINLVPNLSVTENLCLGRFVSKYGIINWKATRVQAEKALRKIGLTIDVRKQVSEYPLAIQQMIAIARAVNMDSKLIIFDEPTSSLDEKEVDELFAVMDNLRDKGLAIIFVTHFLDQVYRISDRITVLRNGSFVGEYLTNQLPRLELIAQMVGQKIDTLEQQETKVDKYSKNKECEKPLIRINKLGKNGVVETSNFEIFSGKTVGLAGLLGSGRTELTHLLFGIVKADQGEINIEGKKFQPSSPREAIKLGFALAPEDRKNQGIIPNLSVRENIILAVISKRGIARQLSASEQIKIADKYIDALKIKTPNREQLVKNLSGGNQQKVLLARWLAIQPILFILDEPTRGIDIGAKTEIETLINQLSANGMSILFISSELEEVTRVSNSIVVMRDKKQISTIDGSKINLSSILETIAHHDKAV